MQVIVKVLADFGFKFEFQLCYRLRFTSVVNLRGFIHLTDVCFSHVVEIHAFAITLLDEKPDIFGGFYTFYVFAADALADFRIPRKGLPVYKFIRIVRNRAINGFFCSLKRYGQEQFCP